MVKSPVIVTPYIKGMFVHSTAVPGGDARYEISYDRLMTNHLQKDPVTLNRSLSVAFTLAHLNRGVKDLSALPFGSLIEIGLARFLGLCTGAWLPEMFSEPQAGAPIVGVTGSLTDDGQAIASYKVFVSHLLAYDFKLTISQSDALFDHLVAEKLPVRRQDGTDIPVGERPSTPINELIPAAGGDHVLDWSWETLPQLRSVCCVTLGQNIWRQFPKKQQNVVIFQL